MYIYERHQNKYCIISRLCKYAICLNSRYRLYKTFLTDFLRFHKFVINLPGGILTFYLFVCFYNSACVLVRLNKASFTRFVVSHCPLG